MDNDGRCTCPGDPITSTHTARFIDQQCNRQVDGLRRQSAVAEYPSVITVQRVLVEALAGEQTSLFATLTLICEHTSNTALKPFGKLQELDVYKRQSTPPIMTRIASIRRRSESETRC